MSTVRLAHVVIPWWIPCSHCDGDGLIAVDGVDVTCPVCEGGQLDKNPDREDDTDPDAHQGEWYRLSARLHDARRRGD